MTVAVHQPQYLPWPGYLDKAANCDVFVFLDTVDYQKRGLQNRNQIKGPDGAFWLTAQVHAKRGDPINKVIFAGNEWKEHHRKAIEKSYARSPGFKDTFDKLSGHLDHDSLSLCELNIRLTNLLFQCFHIPCHSVKASDLVITGTKQDLILSICKACGADTYLSGTGAADYQDPKAFEERGIQLLYRAYHPVEYQQRFPKTGFVPGLSSIDLLFNEPSAAVEILHQGGTTELPKA